MNMLHVIGNLTANPESRTVTGANGENTVCNFSIAVNRKVHGKEHTEFFRITLWNKQAENAMKYLQKGRQVAVVGPVTARAFISNTDNQPRCSMEIQDVVEIKYLGGRAAEDTEYTPATDEPLPF